MELCASEPVSDNEHYVPFESLSDDDSVDVDTNSTMMHPGDETFRLDGFILQTREGIVAPQHAKYQVLTSTILTSEANISLGSMSTESLEIVQSIATADNNIALSAQEVDVYRSILLAGNAVNISSPRPGGMSSGVVMGRQLNIDSKEFHMHDMHCSTREIIATGSLCISGNCKFNYSQLLPTRDYATFSCDISLDPLTLIVRVSYTIPKVFKVVRIGRSLEGCLLKLFKNIAHFEFSDADNEDPSNEFVVAEDVNNMCALIGGDCYMKLLPKIWYNTHHMVAVFYNVPEDLALNRNDLSPLIQFL